MIGPSQGVLRNLIWLRSLRRDRYQQVRGQPVALSGGTLWRKPQKSEKRGSVKVSNGAEEEELLKSRSITAAVNASLPAFSSSAPNYANSE